MYLPNPLDEFESYSVHYVLLACRTSVTAQKFAADDDKSMAQSLAAIDRVNKLGNPVVIDGNANDVFLVIDTRRFAQFTIESLKYDVWINGLQKNSGPSNLVADLSMTVLDSVGISFANFMQWLMDQQMKTNFDGLIFMLRTIFVGHKADGTTETVQSETIPMLLNRMEIDLNFAKGAYTLEFMPNMNFDVNRHSRWLTVSLATTYKSGKGNKLGGIVQSLEDELNRKSTEYYDSVQKILKESGSNETLGRPVKYMITLPSERWSDFEVLGSTPGGAAELRFVPLQAPPKATDKATTATENSTAPSGQLKETYTAVQPSLTIDKVLEAIFRQVPEIAKLGNFQTDASQNTDGFITFYKFIVGITSDDREMMVHVDVVEFKVPNLFTQKQKSTATTVSKLENEFYVTTTDANGIVKREPKNFLEWDYIFSGRNDSILNFDMKIQDFQFLLAQNLRTGDTALRAAADEGGKADLAGASNKDNELLYTRKFDPLVMPLDSAAALKNFSNYTTFLKTRAQSQEIISQTQQYTKNLSMFYAGSPITVVMTIKGNPLIMHKFNMGKLLQHPGSGEAGGSTSSASTAGGSDRSSYRKNLEQEILKIDGGNYEKRGDSFVMKSNLDEKSYAVSPVFARVNIFGPDVDFKTNEAIDEEKNFSRSILSDNYYTIFKLTNQIQGSSFTQDIELYSHNIFGRAQGTKDDNSNANAGTH